MYLFCFLDVKQWGSTVYHVIADSRQDAKDLIPVLDKNNLRQEFYVTLDIPCAPVILCTLEFENENYKG